MTSVVPQTTSADTDVVAKYVAKYVQQLTQSPLIHQGTLVTATGRYATSYAFEGRPTPPLRTVLEHISVEIESGDRDIRALQWVPFLTLSQVKTVT